MIDLYPDSTKALRRWLSDDAITALVERVSVIAKRPPPQVPTLRTAMAQLEEIDASAKALQTAMEGAPWTCDALLRYAPAKFPEALVLRRLADLRAVVRLAAADFPSLRAEGAALARGHRADVMVREVVQAVLASLEAEGVRLTQTGTGAAAVCSQTIIDALASSDAVPDAVSSRFAGVSGLEQVRALIGKPRKRTPKGTLG